MASSRVTQSALTLITGGPNSTRITQSALLLITGGPMPVVICNNPPSGNVGMPYAHSFLASSGTAPYVFSISAGALPTGLSMDALGNVTGTPSAAGQYIFTVQIVDSTPRTATVQCSIQIAAAGGTPGGSISGKFRCCPPTQARKLMEAAQIVRHMLKGSEAWPWDHLYPPPGSIPINLIGDVVSPAVNVITPVLQYQVPIGMKLYLMAALLDKQAGAFNPGDALWTVDENAVGASVQGAGVQGLVSLPIPLGSFDIGRWWPFRRAYEFDPQTLLRSTVVNVNLPVGLPNYFVSCFLGYLVPVR